MSDINELKEVNRRHFLKRLAILGGLVVGGTATLSACGDNTATAMPAPTLTSAPTKAPATPTTAPTKTTAPATSTKAATKPTASNKPDPNFVDVGPLQDFEGVATEPKLISLNRANKKPMQVFVVRQGEKYSALSNICTHQGCEVDWVSQDKLFECPCHGSEYDLDGTNIAGPAPLPLASYSAKVENGRLLISTKK